MKYHALQRLNVHGYVVLPGDVIEDPSGAERLVQRGFIIPVDQHTPTTINVWVNRKGRKRVVEENERVTRRAPSPPPSEEGGTASESEPTQAPEQSGEDSSAAGSSSAEDPPEKVTSAET